MDGDTTARLIYLGLLLASLGGWLMVEFRKRGSQTLRTALAWGLIFLGVMAGYGLWDDIRGDLRPMQQATSEAVVIPRAPDGHYYPTLAIGGQEITFMADTGASSIVLSPQDARRLGFDPESLVYLGQAMTANGPVKTATVTLHDVELGPFRDAGLMAQVNGAEMDVSLLGMDYLGQFDLSIAGEEMVLRR